MIFMDPHIRGFGQNEYGSGEETGGPPFGEGGADIFRRGMQQRLYSRLMAEERYADLDKAKHNPHYLNYLLENYEEDLPY